MIDPGIARNIIRAAIVLAGFIAGFLLVAGAYGLLMPERLVERGIASVTIAYLISLVSLLAGIAGLLLQRYVAGRLPET